MFCSLFKWELFCFLKAFTFYIMSSDFFITTSKFKSTIPYLRPSGKMCFRIQNPFGSGKGVKVHVPYLTLPARFRAAPL